eukprot:Gb_36980 [translate_table: standard]
MRCGGGLLGRMITECKCLSGGVFKGNRCWIYALMQRLSSIFNVGYVDFSFMWHLQKMVMVEDSATSYIGNPSLGNKMLACSRANTDREMSIACAPPFVRDGPGGQAQLNSLSLPMRQGEKECAYYMRTGSSIGSPLPPALAAPYPAGLPSWPLPRAPYVSGPHVQGPPTYMPVIFSPQQANTQIASGWMSRDDEGIPWPSSNRLREQGTDSAGR